MREEDLTPEQRLAINTRDRTLLVSAAAGSGKSSTLVERIIRSILEGATNEEKAIEISDMLIVTYTRASVADLKDKISGEMSKRLGELLERRERLAQMPERDAGAKEMSDTDRMIACLERQLRKLPAARICTIDSYCNDILRMNTERFGISPSYRIADKTEARLLSVATLTALIDAAYRGALPDVCSAEEFEELAFTLVGAKQDAKLEEHFLMLYEKTNTLVEGVDIFRNIADSYIEYAKSPLEDNDITAYAIKSLQRLFSHYLKIYDCYISRLDPEEPIENIYIAFLTEEREIISRHANAVTYEECLRHLAVKFKDAPDNDGGLPQITEIQTMRNAMNKKRKKIIEAYFEFSEDEWRECFTRLASTLGVLHRFLVKFHEVFFEEKRRRAMLEFHDIERLTHDSLYGEDGGQSELARSIASEIKAIYVDEYQDVNALQGSIFDAICRPDNRFMVGDIKQSIYGFRSAKPDIFASMKDDYTEIHPSPDGTSPELGAPTPSTVFMSNNFRCDEGVINFVNGIFNKMFPLVGKSINYDEDNDALVFSKRYKGDTPPYRAPLVRLFDSSAAFDTRADEDDGIMSIAEGAKDLPAIWVAKKIKKLLDGGTRLNNGELARPKDIAIILRANKGRANVYAAALSALGVPARVPEDKDFFNSPEIQLVLCLLNTINNPMRDIYLAGVMCSPIFGFTPDELYRIKNEDRSESLWNALKLYSERADFKKGKEFIRTVQSYRAIAEGMPTDALIMRLYRETGLLALAARGGKRENLMLLYNYARKFEASSFEGLYSFISYVNTVIESNESFETKKEGGESDAVTVITVHSSKGLEYPIVFLGDAGASLTSSRANGARVAYAEGFGAAMRLRRRGGIALLDNPVYNAILAYTSDKAVEEELRVYYVATTRAREQLYITGCISGNDISKYMKHVDIQRSALTPYTLKEVKSFVDILMFSEPECEVVFDDTLVPQSRTETAPVSEERETAPVKEKETESTVPVSDPEDEMISEGGLAEILLRRWSFEYPHKYMTELPSKMSVSRLYPSVLDGADEDELVPGELIPAEEDEEVDTGGLYRRDHIPRFIENESAEREGGIPSTDESAKRGIATHLVLQFCDFGRLKTRGTDAELERLERDGFISHADILRVRRNEIDKFVRSELYREITNARKLYREFRFNVMLPAHIFTTEEARREAYKDKKVLLQGVIDCLIEDESGELRLVDYKTDRLTKEERADRDAARKKLSKYSNQLYYYSLAVKEIFGKEPISRRVYSLPLGDTVDLTDTE